MDAMERILSHPLPDEGSAPGCVNQHGSVVLSVNSGLWGEVSASLRSARIAYDGKAIYLYRYFAGQVSGDNKASMRLVGGAVAADFPAHRVFEHCIAPDPSAPLPGDGPSAIVFQRKEPGVGGRP